jgi:threonyl-tRNA synthetase
MAQAVQELFPDAKLGIGPPVENGFYYDFDVETPFVPEDLAKIETAMRKIIKEGQRSPGGSPPTTTRSRARRRALQARADRLKGSGKSDDAPRAASVEVGAGELTIYDNHRRNGEARLERPVPRPRTCRPPSGSRRSS